MLKRTLLLGMAATLSLNSFAQNIKFTEYNLPNGLHVILHQDKKAPIAVAGVMYNVGSKDDEPGRTGFAHFFEHLLFEGTKNIGRGQWFKIVNTGGGENNANTSNDRTYYFEEMPKNQLELALWMESERMLHPVINDIGVNTQRGVIKEERRQTSINRPYGRLFSSVMENVFGGHAYANTVIGSEEDLDHATLAEFRAFHDKYYVPNNAVLTIAGDIDIPQTKAWVQKYFGDIPRKGAVVHNKYVMKPVPYAKADTVYDANIQVPAILTAYRTENMNSKDQDALDIISYVLSGTASSRLNTLLRDKKQSVVEVFTNNRGMADGGAFFTGALPAQGHTLQEVQADIDAEINRLKTELISEKEYMRVINQTEKAALNQSAHMGSLAEELATNYIFRNGNTNYINQALQDVKKVTREDVRRVANKYFTRTNKATIYYLPAKK